MEKISFSLVALQSCLIGLIFAFTPILEKFTSSPILARKAPHIIAPHLLLLYAYLRRHQDFNPWEAVLPWALTVSVLTLAVTISILHERIWGDEGDTIFHKLDKYMTRYKNSPLPALAYMIGMVCMAWTYKKDPISSLVGTMALAWGDGLSSLFTQHTIKNVYLQFTLHTLITVVATLISSNLVIRWSRNVLGIRFVQEGTESFAITFRMAVVTAISELTASFMPVLRYMDNLIIPIVAAYNSPSRQGFTWKRLKQSFSSAFA